MLGMVFKIIAAQTMNEESQVAAVFHRPECEGTEIISSQGQLARSARVRPYRFCMEVADWHTEILPCFARKILSLRQFGFVEIDVRVEAFDRHY